MCRRAFVWWPGRVVGQGDNSEPCRGTVGRAAACTVEPCGVQSCAGDPARARRVVPKGSGAEGRVPPARPAVEQAAAASSMWGSEGGVPAPGSINRDVTMPPPCRYDAGKDGFIDLMELKLMMEKLGAPQTHLGLKNMIKEVDEDLDSKLSFREFLLIFRKAAAGELQEDSGLHALARLSEIDVSTEGVKGAKSFFEAKVQAIHDASRFEEEIKAEQEEKKKQAEELKQRKAAFKELQSTFKQ
uniref:EF-hand domain family member D2 n=1 Tax=Otus sunia TaxID=257818 RepID=A0A8C8B4A0_9STRI